MPHETGRTYPALAALLNETVERRYGGVRTRLAEDLALTLGYLGRVAAGKQTFSIEAGLRFADLAGLPANRVLSAAGYEAIIPLLERHYGRNKTPILVPVPSTEPEYQKLLRLYAALPVNGQRAVVRVLELMAHPSSSTETDATAQRLALGS